MIVEGVIITAAQRTAGMQAMRGQFIAGAVIHAMRNAGVTTKNGLVASAARRLIASALDDKRISRVAPGRYQGARVH